MKCSQFTDRIIELAFGKADPEASEHAADCPKCAELQGQMSSMAAAFAAGSYNAPAEVTQLAKEIVLQPRGLELRLLRTSLTATGARRGRVESFQCVFEGDGFLVRTMYSRGAGKWQVMITVDPPVVAIQVRGKRVKLVDGKFEFEATRLDGTGFDIIVDGNSISVPAGDSGAGDAAS